MKNGYILREEKLICVGNTKRKQYKFRRKYICNETNKQEKIQ